MQVKQTKRVVSSKAGGKKRINQYVILKQLARGSFGVVKLCRNEDDGQEYAVKIMNKKKLKRKFMGWRSNAYGLVQKELAVLRQIDHPNCVRLYETIDDNHENFAMKRVSGPGDIYPVFRELFSSTEA